MYDSASNDQFPQGGQAYAAYVDGHVGSQPNYSFIVSAFPQAFHLSIAVFSSDDADCLDIEPGAATVPSAAGWYSRQKARGAVRPCFYASADLMESAVIPAINAAGIPRNGIRLWSAHYTGQAHICGPGTCGLTSIDMDGTQWTDAVGALNADQSLLLSSFFGAALPPPPPPVLTQAQMEAILNALPILQLNSADHPGAILYVHRMQQLIAGIGKWNNLPNTQITVDGSFGPATEAALKVIQGFFRLTQDAICGPATWTALVAG
jgi:prepilin-type processing-associated H-X9-DG protein